MVAKEIVRPNIPAAEPGCSDDGRKLEVKVIFTDLSKTAAALQTARSMARGLGARITLMAAQVVPYPLPLAAPDVSVEFTQHQLESIAVDDTAVEIYLCRDRCETLGRVLPRDSVVIVGAPRRRWWPSWETRLTKALRRQGQRVLVVTA